MIESLTQQVFREQLNSSFKLKLNDEQSLDLELIECNDLGSSDVQEQFSLVFRGPGNYYLQQMIYPFVHEKLGDVSIFLVPIKKDDNGYYYEAVFNRFLK